MNNLPFYVYAVFGMACLLSLLFICKAARFSKYLTAVLLMWIALQTVLGLSGYYLKTGSIPPRFLLMVLPPALTIAGLFATKAGRHFVDGLDIKYLVAIHTVRIVVEIVLLWLYLHKLIPQAMTFEGRNFDILSGLSAPLVLYFGLLRNKLSKTIMIIWNGICILLLLNVVVYGILSAPGPIQHLSFHQPNVAILLYPFNLLPALIVPLVLFSHLATIRILAISRRSIAIDQNIIPIQ